MKPLTLGTKPTTMHELKKYTDKELHSYLRTLANQANQRLKEVKQTGFQNYSNVYARKYNTQLYGNTIPNLATSKHMFSTKKASSANMIERIYQLERYLQSPYTSAEHVKQYVQDSMDKWGIDDEKDLKKLFDAYRDFGGDDYHSDSDTVLQAFSDIINEGYNIKKALKVITKINESMEYRTVDNDVSNVMSYRDYITTAKSVGKGRKAYSYAETMTKADAFILDHKTKK